MSAPHPFPAGTISDPVAQRLHAQGRGDLIETPNAAYPWAPLYDRSSDAYIYHDGGPLQADRFADEASSIERLVFSHENLLKARRVAAAKNGYDPDHENNLPSTDVTLHYLKEVYNEEVPYGDMMTPSLRRGVYGPGFLQRVADKITERATSRIARNVKADVQTQRFFHLDQQTHGIRGVFAIDRPQYAGTRGGNDLSWQSRLPPQWQ
jgi:hypothetical protein